LTFNDGTGSNSSLTIVEALDSLSLPSSLTSKEVDPLGFFEFTKEDRRRCIVSDSKGWKEEGDKFVGAAHHFKYGIPGPCVNIGKLCMRDDS
jgi:hypothetical protein